MANVSNEGGKRKETTKLIEIVEGRVLDSGWSKEGAFDQLPALFARFFPSQ